MIDSYGRKLDYLRISLTDRCNLRCLYCMPKRGVSLQKHEETLTFEELLRLSEVFIELGIQKIKITGGEPFARKGAANFIEKLKKDTNVKQVTVTTNGLLLESFLPQLQQAGIDGINISLDTLRPAQYAQLTGADKLTVVLQALSQAVNTGIPVKINTVPLKNINEQEYGEIAMLAKEKVQAVRFIELMPIGQANNYHGVSLRQVKKEIEKAHGTLQATAKKHGNGPAEYYALPNFKGNIGFISAVSHEFCGACNRLRLTSLGMLKLCLGHSASLDLKALLRNGAADETIKQEILRAVEKKPRCHAFNTNEYNGENLPNMNAVGG